MGGCVGSNEGNLRHISPGGRRNGTGRIVVGRVVEGVLLVKYLAERHRCPAAYRGGWILSATNRKEDGEKMMRKGIGEDS